MKFWVGVTDGDWFSFLSKRNPPEVNFWRPGGRGAFHPIPAGAPFLFKLHSPNNFIVGGGFFVKYSILPLSLAWEAFGQNNGATTEEECRRRIQHYRRVERLKDSDPEIGCIVLTNPFFFDRSNWVKAPEDWASSIVVGKTYDTEDSQIGFGLWEKVKGLLGKASGLLKVRPEVLENEERYGESYLTKARLGQGAFRVLVTETYQRRCAVTGEKTLPVLEAAHIQPYAKEGPHNIQNGLLLRSDFHTLFDKHLITINPKWRIQVSPKIKERFNNGKEYYAYDGKELKVLPEKTSLRPSADYLKWHNERFLV